MRQNIAVDSQWRTLASVGIGYAAATGLIFVLFFLLPYFVVRAI